MNFLKRIFQKDGDPSAEWCITYIDSNNFRRERVQVLLKEAGVEVKAAKEHLTVPKQQYEQAMSVLKGHGY